MCKLETSDDGGRGGAGRVANILGTILQSGDRNL